ncbi:hypothetical protein [Peterkaempfera bronchialis]|uniref:Uncharacterized protein n=1 Tax=Peterkaempfera bronchialis TaxID=2126346 RepID=A0A345SY87_9ACTN|nr:hypothetical protein [Peterkaempfera bronchialis]AXI78692.1 hypothetical protein C7M71_015925 [Peterkaempfera bronchialis]
MPADQMALMWGESATAFTTLLGEGFRRAAMTSWLEGDTDFRVRLIQYGPADTRSAVAAVQDAADCGHFTDDPCTSRAIPGTVDGVAYVTRRSETYHESKKHFYRGLAVARRGNVEMRIDVHSPRKVDLDRVLDLAKRQWERL